MLIADVERAKYESMWTVDGYNRYSPGEENAQRFAAMLTPLKGSTILDAGCGAGKGGLALEALGFRVWYLDITDAGLDLGIGVDRHCFIQQPLWKRITKPHPNLWDYGFCCDVMEHLPTEYTMLAVRNLLEACRTVWFQIAFFEDGWGASIGEELHLTVRPFSWWNERLQTIGSVIDARDLCGDGIFVVERNG